MHIQMKEAMSADIDYLRKLNLQLVEQHMKGIGLYTCTIASSLSFSVSLSLSLALLPSIVVKVHVMLKQYLFVINIHDSS